MAERADHDHLDPTLDHIVYATPHLERTVRQIEAMLGVSPVAGGPHPGRATRNFLLGLGGRRYLEIIGPDAAQPDPPEPRWFGIDDLAGPRVVGWAVRAPDIDARVAAWRARGHDPGAVTSMSRRAPDNTLLTWRLTPPQAGDPVGLVPFLIDWRQTTHPTERGLPVVPLVSFTAVHPEASVLRARLAELAVRLDVRPGERAELRVTLAGPHGPVTLS